jgi:hypothetical protein
MMDTAMPEEIGSGIEQRIAERAVGGWRIIASAWVVAFVFMLMFAGVQAFASRHGVSPHQASLSGVVIPRHDPTCTGSGDLSAVSEACQAARAEINRADAESYADW